MTPQLTALDRQMWAAVRRHLEPPAPTVRRWASPLDMAEQLDPTIVRTPALELINRALVDLTDGRVPGNKLAVFMSPQEGKSTLCSYWYPLWTLVTEPDTRFLSISYSDEMARRWGADVKLALETYTGDEDTVDLGLSLRADSRAAGRWQIDGRKGGIYCAGVNGSITGKPADQICVDDPLKNLEEAQSPAYRDRVLRTYRGVLIPRRGPNTKIVWIQTLWHEAEPISQILENEPGDWRVVRIPAICDSPDDPLGRDIGEPMISARGHRDWAKIRRDVGEFVFSALYQQRPAPAEGGMFKRLWWRYWSLVSPRDYGGERLDLAGRLFTLADCWRFATMDLAASTKTSADWTVAAAWALTIDGDLVLLDRVRARIGEADHYSIVRPLVERWKLDTAFVERSQYGTTLARDAVRGGVHLTPVDADTDKITRAIPYSARVSGGRVWLPAGARWLTEWVDEHASFPNGRNDDQCDAGAYATRIVVTKWQPPPQRPPEPVRDDYAYLGTPTPDLLTVPM